MSAELAIPVRNVYALLAYAFEFLEVSDPRIIEAGGADTPVALLARLLNEGLRKLLRRGAYRAYGEQSEPLRQLKGACDVTRTIAQVLMPQGKAHCRFDELSFDVAANRALKAAARAALAAGGLSDDLERGLRESVALMSDVSDVALNAPLLRGLTAPRGHLLYGPLLCICSLIHRNLLPGEDGSKTRIQDFTRNEKQMSQLFEAFVRNFLARELSGVRVRRENLRWADASGTEPALSWLPIMRTDVTVVTAVRRTIIETKYYRAPFSNRYETAKIRSGHIYQLFSYLKNAKADAPEQAIDGILVYAAIGQQVRESFKLGSTSVTLCTLDLNQPWVTIRAALLGLLAPSLDHA